MPRIARILPEKVFFSFWPEVTITNGFFIVAKILNMKIEPFPFLFFSLIEEAELYDKVAYPLPQCMTIANENIRSIDIL